MIPVVLFLGLIGFIRWAALPKNSGITGELLPGVPMPTPSTKAPDAPAPKPEFYDSSEPPGLLGPPLQPEEERLFTLLVLWIKDKEYPAGQKRYFTRGLADETAKIAERLGLPATARAVMTDGPVPRQERLGKRGTSIYNALVMFIKKSNGQAA